MQDLAVLFRGNNPWRLLGGMGVTLKLSLVSVALSVALGLAVGALMTLKKNQTLDHACTLEESGIANLARYRARSIPAVGAQLKAEDSEEKQISILE